MDLSRLAVQSVEYGDARLWMDGTIQVEPEHLATVIGQFPASRIAVTRMTPEVEHFNRTTGNNLHVKTECAISTPELLIPDQFRTMDIRATITDIFARRVPTTDPLYAQRRLRIDSELELIETMGIADLFRVIFFVIAKFRYHDVVWGVGRGSSCASYILYLIGLHCVDSVEYGIPAREFFHD